MMKVLKAFFLLFTIMTLTGCLEREIYTEISDRRVISHPPKSMKIDDPSGGLNSTFKQDHNSPVSLEVYTHSAHCTNAQSRSLGSDFDGYIRITIKENNTTIARAQMDYKGSPEREKIQQVYDHLMDELQW